MEGKVLFILFSILTTIAAFPSKQDIKLVTEAKPGQEYVSLHRSSGSDVKPNAKKNTDEGKHFETAHKLPPNVDLPLDDEEDDIVISTKERYSKHAGKKVHKRQAAELPAPAPPGAIKLNVSQLLQKYKEAMKTSTPAPTSSTAATTTRASSRRRGTKKRSRRGTPGSLTTPSPVLTTAKITAKNIDTDVVGAASEKQRSRIQVKKAPNGQEYEYEYVYYYYDDDEDSKDKVTNAHDGPARNSISRSDKSREKAAPEVNEVLPSRGKSRSRQLGEEEVQEERLPANTRFPPRSRNLNTTPVPQNEPKPAASRTRVRGKPATESAVVEDDNVSDETQASRGRTRANVRRPSLELVDSETFNTHSAAPPAASQSPTFPAQLPAGPEEAGDKQEATEQTSKPNEDDSTTSSTRMNKVALDLYAISQGTQKLFGEEDAELSTEEDKDGATTLDSSSTEEVETTTSTTTTTTTTTTTPAPTTTRTTTTTTEAPTKASRFGGRRTGLASARKTTTTTTEAPSATEGGKPKKFVRPSFGGRARTKATAAPAVEEEAHKEESKPGSQAKPGRARFGASRQRGRTTAAPEVNKEDTSSTSAPASSRPSLPRARPSFNNLRNRGRSTTAAPSTDESGADSEGSSSEPSTTTARPARRIAGATANIKPLRPGPRINLAGRRGSQTTTTTTEAAKAEDTVPGDEEETHAEAASEKEEAPAPAPVDNSPLGRLRNKNRLNIQPKSKSGTAASASSPVQVRRPNPLLGRRRPGQTTEAPSSEAPSSEATEQEADEPAAETEPAPSSTTTEEPKGLNKLLAGRRRLAARTPGTINHK